MKLTASHYKRDVSEELETALSVITTAYLRTEDIVTAVEENVTYVNPPVSRVFRSFLMQVKLVDPDVEAAIKAMQGRIDNGVFREWCDALCDCLHDRSLKTTLTPIVAKLSDMRNVNADLDYMVAEPRKEFLLMVLFVVGNIPAYVPAEQRLVCGPDAYGAGAGNPGGDSRSSICICRLCGKADPSHRVQEVRG